jgi:hypothetical protein
VEPQSRPPWRVHLWYLLGPFLAAGFFVLTLAAANAEALNGWEDLGWPLLSMVAISAVFMILAAAWTRSAEKAALLTLLWVTAFSLFGYVSDSLLRSGSARLVGGETGLVGLVLVSLVGPSLAIRRARRSLASLNAYVSLVATLLVTYTTLSLYVGLEHGPTASPGQMLPPEGRRRVETPLPPDIYLLLLDNYTRGDLLLRSFGYDNSRFESYLRNHGFIVPKHARANYPQTQLVLASMLNFDYVQNLPANVHLYDLIENNRLAAYLKAHHYRFVFFPTGFKVSARNRNAEVQLPEPAEVKDEFGGVWQRTTMLPEVLRLGCGLLGCRAGRLVYVSEDANRIDWKFRQLGRLGADRPTSALAHIVVAHEPFLYRADCSHREPYWPTNAGTVGDKVAERAYLDQIGCLNTKLMSLIDSLTASPGRDRVILLQADHGYGRLGRRLPDYRALSPSQVSERLSVFAAYLLPGVSPDSIGDSISPINAVRVMLRYYFNADVPPLPEASYWSTGSQPRSLVRVDR